MLPSRRKSKTRDVSGKSKWDICQRALRPIHKVRSSRLSFDANLSLIIILFQVDNHYLETLFILTNERDPTYLDELKSSFVKSWKNIVISSLEIEYGDAQEKDVGMAVDMDLARRAAVFLGNGVSQ